jgi:hypothetical protein
MADAAGTNDPHALSVTHDATLSEGYHYVTLLGAIAGGATLTFHSADTPPSTAKCRIMAAVPI